MSALPLNTPPHDKKRFPWAHGMTVASMLVASLRAGTSRIEIAGSLRREKAFVGDVELVYVPQIVEVTNKDSLFPEVIRVNAANEVIAVLEREGVLGRRLNVNGSESFGTKNKLMVHLRSGVPVDLFAATEESWWNYLVCRTGGAKSNVDVATAAQRKGWTWNPYGPGFSRVQTAGAGQQVTIVHTVSSEREVFEFVGLPYREPRLRP